MSDLYCRRVSYRYTGKGPNGEPSVMILRHCKIKPTGVVRGMAFCDLHLGELIRSSTTWIDDPDSETAYHEITLIGVPKIIQEIPS